MINIIDFLETHQWLFDGVGGALALAVIGGIARIAYYKLFKQNNTDPNLVQVVGDNSVALQSGGSLTVNKSHFGDKKNVK